MCGDPANPPRRTRARVRHDGARPRRRSSQSGEAETEATICFRSSRSLHAEEFIVARSRIPRTQGGMDAPEMVDEHAAANRLVLLSARLEAVRCSTLVADDDEEAAGSCGRDRTPLLPGGGVHRLARHGGPLLARLHFAG